jgi:glycosyltransferase involved in cell wall biosynthesis
VQSGHVSDTPFLSIVIPVFNEEASLDALVPRLFGMLERENLAAEVICVDDGSTDNSWDRLVAWRARYPALTLVSLSRNFGKEIAIAAGLDLAEGNAVVLMDADLQHPPEIIPQFIAAWQAGHDVAYGVRRNRAQDGVARRKFTQAFYRVFNALSNTPITPDAGDFRLMDRKVVDAIRRMRERSRFMKGIYAWVGFKSISITFDVPERAHGKSSFSASRLFGLAFDGILSFSTVPLRMAMYTGAVVAAAALALGAFYLIRTLVLGIDVPGYASLIVSVLALSGFMMLQLGLMGLYLGRIYDEVKARPLYLIREIIGQAADTAVDPGVEASAHRLKNLV